MAGLQRGDAPTLDAYHLVFDVVRMRAKDIGALLGYNDSDSEEVQRLAAMNPDNVCVSFTPAEVPKYGSSLMAPLFVGLVALATGRKIKKSIVITGEIGLWYMAERGHSLHGSMICDSQVMIWSMIDRGRIYQIGSLGEKMRIARTTEFKTIVRPSDNKSQLMSPDLMDISVGNIFDLLRATMECE